MGKTTSELIERAREISPTPPRRELDMLLSSGERISTALLAMAIEEAGHRAISLTGPQSGILTDGVHGNATIVDVRADRVAAELAAGQVVIVAGFQGIGPSGEVTTLGRGGSDTSALAMAGALGAESCEIFSDVSGVYTADPRIVDDPLHLEQVDSALMAEYALHGARVLHPACIAMARQKGVAIHARSTFGEPRYTRIRCQAELAFSTDSDEAPTIVGVTSRKSRVHVRGRGHEARLYERALECIGGDEGLLRQRSDSMEHLLVDIEDVVDPERVTAMLKEDLRDAAVTTQLASVSVVSQPVVTPELLARVGLVLEGIAAPHSVAYRRPHSVTYAVPAVVRKTAVRAIHSHFVEEPLAVGG
jgi:aspartate kinase